MIVLPNPVIPVIESEAKPSPEPRCNGAVERELESKIFNPSSSIPTRRSVPDTLRAEIISVNGND